MVLFHQETEEYSGVIIVAPDFRIVVVLGCQAIAINGVIMLIPKFRIDMIIGSQAITFIIILEK